MRTPTVAAPAAPPVPSPTLPRGRKSARLVGVLLVAGYALLRLGREGWWDLLDDVNLAIHEAGHLLFIPLGEMMTVLGGSLLQVAVPAAFVAWFFRSRQPFAGAVTLAWVGASLVNVSRYIGDARARELPLLGGDDAIHDWEYLLSMWGLLAHDLTIARGVHAAAAATFIAAIAIGVAKAGER